ncbi:hypothetical protein P5W99_37350 [Paraburkholderia sp. A3BS-1L]|uniref:hypothetical protein n=1 Tax=Paraburkholderia sp. A3BS-1L TaxID=3028375 RepID=UPI003DA81079
MNWYSDVEQELAHIKGAIDLLEQTRTYLTNPTPVSDPAYWRAAMPARSRSTTLHRPRCFASFRKA